MGLRADLMAWLDVAVTTARAPAYQTLVRHTIQLLDEERLTERLERAWGARRFEAAFDRPLLWLAALRHEALVAGEGNPLHPWLVGEAAGASATRAELVAALEREGVWRSLEHRHVQTNETSRAVAWRWPAALAGGRPIALFDMGCSAGLNLVADALPAVWVAQDGRAIPVAPVGEVVLRRGFDARPIDVRDDDDATWLRACVWPGERDRQARLEAAIAAMREARGGASALAPDAGTRPAPLELVSTDLAAAPALVEELAARLPRGTLAIAYQSHVRDYLPSTTLAAYRAGMERWLRAAPGDALWIELEPVFHAGMTAAAAISAHVVDGAALRTLVLADCPHHPRELSVHTDSASTLARLLGS